MLRKTTQMMVRALLAYGMLMVVVVPTGCDRTMMREFAAIGRDGPSIYWFNPQPEPPRGIVYINPQPEPPGGEAFLGPQPEPPDSPAGFNR